MKRNRLYERSLFHAALNLPYDDESRAKIHRSSKGDVSLLQRMGMIRSLDIHSGCVNTISWNETGEYLLSGSDDQHLIITDAFTHKVVEDYKTSHRANIFSAKFLPCIRDSRIVSCSGDGIILFTDLMSPELVYKPFNCHCGTAYKVATVPLDPHSFLSCGEDGTVRWFDLRVKTSCNKLNCQEDVMIQCQRAVTAMSINPTAPFELAIGCSDSTVRLFDRRMLGTKATGTKCMQAEPLCAFTVPSFKRAYRISSLCFSPEGEEILVNYSSDDLYLFSLRGKENNQNKIPAAVCKKAKIRLPSSDPTPVRRLRLRGDWSDTGPDARPEREAGGRGDIAQARPTLHTPLMQHLTNVISRLLNDPATRAALTSGVDDAGSSENSLDAPGPSGIINNVDEEQDSDSQSVGNPSSRNPTGPEVFEHPLQEYELFDHASTSHDANSDSSRNIESVLSEGDNATVDCYVAPFDTPYSPDPSTSSQSQTEYQIAPLRDPQSDNGSSRSSTTDYSEAQQNQHVAVNLSESPAMMFYSDGTNDSTAVQPSDTCSEGTLEAFDDQSSTDSEATTRRKCHCPYVRPNFQVVTQQGGIQFAGRDTQAESGAQMERGIGLAAISEAGMRNESFVREARALGRDENRQTESTAHSSRAMYAETGIHEHDLDTLQSRLVHLREGYIERNGTEPGVRVSYSHLGTNSSTISLSTDNEDSSSLDPSYSPVSAASPRPLFIDEDSQQPFHPAPEAIAGPSSQNFGSSSDSMSDRGSMFSDEDSEEDEEDLRRELRNRISPPGLGHCSRNNQETPFPEIKQRYSGHRNARTMIKEATFWGKDYIMSGSDCGHVFVWDRVTAKLVMLLQADQHVVNCIQPHPTEPLLATSGIDYDVKLWAPVGDECRFDQNVADEIVKRNALMLEETRDTITVPASFMIRMVACLNQIRRGGRSRSRRRTLGSQDD